MKKAVPKPEMGAGGRGGAFGGRGGRGDFGGPRGRGMRGMGRGGRFAGNTLTHSREIYLLYLMSKSACNWLKSRHMVVTISH